YSAARKDIKNMNKVISFDSTMSLTATNADIRFRIKPSQQILVVMNLIAEMKKLGLSMPSQFDRILPGYASAFAELKIDAKLFQKMAKDLYDAKGKSLIVAGGIQTKTKDAATLQIAVNFLNSALNNEGQTVRGQASHSPLQASSESLQKLIEKMEKGEVSTLIIHRTNPLFGWIDAKRFAEATKKVEMVITTSDRMDEVAHISHMILPDHHVLENWGDAEFNNGLYAIQQPAIANMYGTRSFQFNLMTWCYEAERGPKRILDFESYYDYLRNIWKTEVYPQHGRGLTFEAFWQSVLQKGFVGDLKQAGFEDGGSGRSFRQDSLNQLSAYSAQSGYELALYTKSTLGDGSLSNVSWLQELPDPVTKIVWDNYVMVSVATAEREKLKEGVLISVTSKGKTLKLPVHIQPGLHDEVLAVAIGYGRTHTGKVGNNVGINVLPWGTWDETAKTVIYSGHKVELKSTGEIYRLACTQAHHSMEGRQIVVEATLNDYLKKPDANIHKHHIWSLWPGHRYNGHKWGMALDLNTCTGCSACVIACQSENNIPVVGKKYVLQGREMHWIRIDRYYTGDAKNGDTIGAVFQPVMCQHCDNAPCETVCPVLATVHSSEGLNEMVYNRCVGTRYCSNNCPYKVRRFNWFNYLKGVEAPSNMVMNPDVTVRVRGVMEKCTFCVQRIKDGKNKAKLENRKLQDGEIKTACQVACPTDVIVFGDLNDPQSKVAQVFKNEPRSYALLEEWGAAPAVRYMSRIRNNDKVTVNSHGTDSSKEHSLHQDQRQQSEQV
ncbi:MAG: 4Fe-4S dicluster domain-containing protein, partial [Pseudobdellovibrionaceae bacterium]